MIQTTLESTPQVAANAAAGTLAREEAKHKELLAQFKIFKGVEQALKDHHPGSY